MRNYLAQQSEITVVVGIGPGHGHQKAAVTGMLRLQELGFKGKFAVIFEGDNKYARNKFEFLAKSYPEIKWKAHSEEKAPSNDLGATFACDDHYQRKTAEGFAKHYRTKDFIKLGPTGWMKGAQQIYAHDSNHELPEDVATDGILECGSGASSMPPEGISREVKTLVKGQSKGNWQLISIYGLHDWPAQSGRKDSSKPEVVGLSGKDELGLLLEGLLARGSGGPAVVCVVGELPEIPSEIKESKRFKKVFDSAFLSLPAFRLSKGEVALVHLSKVDEKDFHHLVRNADLFVAEGANSLSFAKKSGTPFLIGGRQILQPGRGDEHFLDQENFKKASTALTAALDSHAGSSVTQEAHASPSREQRLEDLSAYLDKCLEGQLKSFYEQGAERFLSRPDKVFEAVHRVASPSD